MPHAAMYADVDARKFEQKIFLDMQMVQNFDVNTAQKFDMNSIFVINK